MAPRDLSFAELLGATAPLGEGGTARALFAASPVGALYLSELDELRALIAPAPSRSTADERITEELATVDANHDGGVRYADGLLALNARHHPDAELRTVAARLRALLFPEGIELVRMSFAEEAGRAESRALAMTPDVRTELNRFMVPTLTGTPVPLSDWLDANLQTSARRLGELLAMRSRLASESGPTPAALLTAKRKLTSLYAELLKALRRDRLLDEHQRSAVTQIENAWSAAVKDATQRAERRRAAGQPAEPTDNAD